MGDKDYKSTANSHFEKLPDQHARQVVDRGIDQVSEYGEAFKWVVRLMEYRAFPP